MTISSEAFFKKVLTPAQRRAAKLRSKKMIAEYQTLQQLRKARELTQVQLAKRLKKDQVSVSQLEQRSDLLLSTLRGYVEAMGGNLQLIVKFKGQAPISLAGFSSEESMNE